GNFTVGNDGQVSVIDTESLMSSMDTQGRGKAPAAADVGRFYESLRVFGEEAGLSDAEIAKVQEEFLAAYKEASKTANVDLDATVEFYAVNLDIIALKAEIAGGDAAKIATKTGLLEAKLGVTPRITHSVPVPPDKKDKSPLPAYDPDHPTTHVAL